jgi:hypothetical protein
MPEAPTPTLEATPRRARLNGAEWAAVAIGAVLLVLAVRGKANSTPCIFASLIAPAVLIGASVEERRRAGRAARALWASVERFPETNALPWAAAAVFAAVPTALLCLSNDRVETIGDTVMVIPTAVSLVTEGNTDLDEFHRPGVWWYEAPASDRIDGVSYFLKRSGGRLYASHPVGLAPLALPIVAASKLAGGRLDEPIVQLRLEKLTAATLAGTTLGLFFLAALHLVRPAPALATTALLAVASAVFTTLGQNLWEHGGVALGSMALVLLEFRRPGRWGTLGQGVVCGLMPACRLTAASVLAPFGLWVLCRSPRRAAWLAAGAVVAFAPWALYHQSVYGNPLGPSMVHAAGSNWSAAAAASGLAGVLFSPGRGMLVYQPWLVLAALAVAPGLRRRAERWSVECAPAGWGGVCLAAVVLDVAIVSAWHCWWGGWCWGSRLVAGVAPIGGLLCVRPVAALWASRRGRGVLAVVLTVGSLAHLPAVYAGAFRWNARHAADPTTAAWSWRESPFFEPFRPPLRPRPALAVRPAPGTTSR